MKCPVCIDPDLMMTDRQGIEIDYCPKCRGVWLDRGELDKIIERSSSASPAAQAEPRQVSGRYEEHRPHSSGHRDHYHKKKKGGLLGELFDF